MARTGFPLLSSVCLFTLSSWLPIALATAANGLAPRDYSFKPTPGTTWNIELIHVPSVSQADDPAYSVWDYDLFDAPKSTVQAFQHAGKKVICYFSAGSWENWRPDANQFPAVAKDKALDGWPGERWLDTRNKDVRDIMAARIKLAASKGCDAVDPDNVDGYANPTGFSLTKADSVDYIKFLAQTAHDNGMACSLKNGPDMAAELVNFTDFEVNEQCVRYNECNKLQPFIAHNKAVFHIEYTAKKTASAAFIKKACTNKGAAGFSTLIKHLNLNSWTTECPK